MALETNTTSIEALIPEIVTEAEFQAFENALMPQLVRNYNVGAGDGLSVEVPTWNTLTSAAVAENADLINQESTTTSVTITASEYGLMTTVTDKAQYASQESIISAQGKQHGMAIAEALDTELLALFSTFGTTQGDGTGALVAADIFAAVARLRALKLSITDIACVISPGVAYDLKSSMTQAYAGLDTELSNEIMRSAYVGRMAGVPVYESGNMVSTAGQSLGAVFSRQALGLVNQKPLAIETQRDASYRHTELVSTVSYGMGALNDTYGVGMDYLSSIGV